MRRRLVSLLVPILMIVIGMALYTAFEWAAAAILAVIGFIAFAAIAWWSSFGLSSESSDDIDIP